MGQGSLWLGGSKYYIAWNEIGEHGRSTPKRLCARDKRGFFDH